MLGIKESSPCQLFTQQHTLIFIGVIPFAPFLTTRHTLISKWNHVGIQGALLTQFLEPLFVSKYLILLSEKSKLDITLVQERMNRSIIARLGKVSHTPTFHLFKESSTLPSFLDRASDEKIKGSGYSIGCFPLITNDSSLTNLKSYKEEIVIGMKGHKQGTTKKDENSPKSASQLSKHSLFESFVKCA